MDGKERLRRYLEQRRDAGERELLLDSMTVDEVMRIVTGLPREADAPTLSEGRATENRPSLPTPPGAEVAPANAVERPASDDTDWRSVLAAAAGDVPVPRPVEPLADTRRPSPRSSPPVSPAASSGASFPGVTSSQIDHAVPTLPPRPPGSQDARPAAFSGSQWRSALAGWIGVWTSKRRFVWWSARVAAHTRGRGARCGELHRMLTLRHGEEPSAGRRIGDGVARLCGEAPGATEDETGRPFVGQGGPTVGQDPRRDRSGARERFHLQCAQAPAARQPQPAAGRSVACSHSWCGSWSSSAPASILAFGTFAAQTLLQTTQPIGKLRGAVHRYYGVPLIVTYHPAALLRNPAWKRPTWEDVQYARRILDGTGV